MNRSMSLDNMSFTEALSKAVNAVIRPPRAEYDENNISFIVYDMHSPPIPRIPISFPNRRGERIVGSLYQSISFDTEKIHRCIIYLHGNIGSQKEGRFIVPFYAPHGISVFCFDFSGSGNSGGKFVTLGKNERTDVIDVIKFLQEGMYFQEFILWGRSMGASCAIMSTAILTHEVDQHYDKIRQNKLTNSTTFSLGNPHANSTNNFYQNPKRSNSFSLKRDSLESDSPASILSKETQEEKKSEPTHNSLFQSTPILEKNKNLLSKNSDSPLVSTNTDNSNEPEKLPSPRESNEYKANLHLNPQMDQMNSNNENSTENAKKSNTHHLEFETNTFQKRESDDDSVLKAVPRIRKAKSQYKIEKKNDGITKDKSDGSLSSIPNIYKPKTRASLPAMISPFMSSILPKQSAIPIQDLIIQQNQSPHQTPLFKPESAKPESTQSEAHFHIQPSKPNQPKKMPKPPKPPKPPQHMLHESTESSINDKKSSTSDIFDSDDSTSQEKKKPNLRIPVKGIIVDSAYSSLEDMLNAISSHVNLGSISSFVAQWYIKRSVYDQVGLTCKDVQPVESAKLCWRVPMLLGHSPKDDFVPFEQAQKIYSAYAGPKELVILSGGHNSERDENWMNVCTKFIATYFGIELEQLKQKITSQRPEHAASFMNLIKNDQH